MTFPELFERFATTILPLNTSDATHLRFQSIARFASARAGDAPYKGNGHDQIAFVVSGSTKLVAHASQGREQVIAFHFAGDLVSVPASAAHAYSLCALEDCELIFFPADEFMQLARQESGMIMDILERAMSALARCREKTISLGRKTAQERLASFLVTLADRVGVPSTDGIEIKLPMSRRDISDSLGLTIETVSRQLTDLRSEGLLETPSRSNMRLLNLNALKDRAGHIQVAA